MRKHLAIVALVVIALLPAAGSASADDKFQQGFAPARGAGGLVSDNGQIILSVAPDTAGVPLTIRYTPDIMNTVPAAPSGTIWVGSPFTLEVFNADIGQLTSTDRPMTLIVNYDPGTLGGRPESTLRIVRYYDRWADFPSTVDSSRHTVTTQVSFSGNYGLVASSEAPAPAPVAPAPTAVPAPAPAPVPAPAPAPAPAAPPAFRLGFATLASLIPNVAGQPLENEHYGANGDSLQQTTTGLMVWRKADNWTAFTNGSRTWVNGPFGVMERGNNERFDWEAR